MPTCGAVSKKLLAAHEDLATIVDDRADADHGVAREGAGEQPGDPASGTTS